MALTQDEIEKIRETWARLVPVSSIAAELFYGRLFKQAPGVRPLFSSDMTQQRQKLMQTLAFVVDHLDDLDQLTPAARDLAIRHVGYGVKADQYPHVGDALIWTFRRMLGAGFGPEEESAWTNAYGFLSSTMVAAAYGETTSP